MGIEEADAIRPKHLAALDPLRLVGMDAAPVRALLFETGGTFSPYS